MGVFTERLKASRENANFTMNGLGEKVGLFKGNYSPYEKANTPRMPSVEMAAKFATALNVSLDYLTGLTDDPRPVNQILADMATAPNSSAPTNQLNSTQAGDYQHQINSLQAQINNLQAKLDKVSKIFATDD